MKTQEEEKETTVAEVETTSEKKEIEDGIEQMKIQGDQEAAEEIEEKMR